MIPANAFPYIERVVSLLEEIARAKCKLWLAHAELMKLQGGKL